MADGTERQWIVLTPSIEFVVQHDSGAVRVSHLAHGVQREVPLDVAAQDEEVEQQVEGPDSLGVRLRVHEVPDHRHADDLRVPAARKTRKQYYLLE